MNCNCLCISHCVTRSLCPCLSADGVQDRGVGDLGLHREQSRGGYSLGGAISAVDRGPPAAVSFPQCQSTEEAVYFPRCLMELSSSSLWPPWWPPQWPTVPVAPGTPSVSSSRCASGGSRGLLMVRVGFAGWGVLIGVLYCQVTKMDTVTLCNISAL